MPTNGPANASTSEFSREKFRVELNAKLRQMTPEKRRAFRCCGAFEEVRLRAMAGESVDPKAAVKRVQEKLRAMGEDDSRRDHVLQICSPADIVYVDDDGMMEPPPEPQNMPEPIEGFDAIAFTRKVRAELNAKLENMTIDERVEFLRADDYDDPVFSRLAQRVVDPQVAAERRRRKRAERSNPTDSG